MSLKAEPIGEVPELTSEIARAALSKGNNYMKLRDELGTIYEDRLFADLYAHDGQPATSPWRLALVTVLQFAENLPDRQAADAVRSRIDWKYLLGLEMTDPGFDYSILCEFRARLVTGDAVSVLLDRLIEVLKDQGLVKTRPSQRTDSTHILAAVRDLSRLERVGKTMLHVLNSLAVVDPEWLKSRVQADWPERYLARWEDYHLPKSKAKRFELGEQVGRDGIELLEMVYSEAAPPLLRDIPAVETLRQIWVQNFYEDDSGLHWRQAGNIPPAGRMICSHFDLQMRFNTKRQTQWAGYKVHLTETCDPDSPHVITHVITTPATIQDTDVVSQLHQSLFAKNLLPGEHLLDMGYSATRTMLEAIERFGVGMVMLMRSGHSWQQQDPEAYDLSHFHIDWVRKRAICPQRKESGSWVEGQGRKGLLRYEIMFNQADCGPCPARQLCTRAKRPRRKIAVLPQPQHELLETKRKYEHTEAFKSRYGVRAGVEGTISQAVRALSMRRSRYRTLEKTHLQHMATAAAINLKRIACWLNNPSFSTTSLSQFGMLMAS
jgi:transposase